MSGGTPVSSPQEKPGRVTIPHPKKDLPKGALASIERQAGMSLV